MNTHDKQEQAAAELLHVHSLAYASQLLVERAKAYAGLTVEPGDVDAQAVAIILAAFDLATKDLSTERRKALILETMK